MLLLFKYYKSKVRILVVILTLITSLPSTIFSQEIKEQENPIISKSKIYTKTFPIDSRGFVKIKGPLITMTLKDIPAV